MRGREGEGRERSVAAPTHELSLACTLGPVDGAMGIDRWKVWAEIASPSARRAGDALDAWGRCRFTHDPGWTLVVLGRA